MKILVIHLSDLHLKTISKSNYIQDHIGNITNAIFTQAQQIDKIIIFFTGDITFSGQEVEFDFAEDFILNLIISIEEKFKIKPIIELVPGNHDCDFSSDDVVREIVRKDINETEIDNSVIQKMTECQDRFFSFYKKITGSRWKNEIYSEKTYNIQNITIDIVLINSAWMTIKKEIPGTLILPMDSISFDSVAKSDLVFTLLHHPYNWFTPTNKRNLQKFIENNSDIIFFGHEHEYAGYKKLSFNDSNVQYVEGSILQEDTFEKRSNFNILVINPESKKCETTNFSWDGKNQIYKPEVCNEFELSVNPVRPNDTYTLNPAFSAHINDIGMGFSHPEIEKIDLQQLFVYPNIRAINKKEESFEKSLIKENIIDFICTKKRVAFLGPEKSGKTTLCKKIFSDFFDKGFRPILLDGKDIKNHDEKGIQKTLTSNFHDIYHTPISDIFLQETSSKKVLIIDNFENCRINEKQKCNLLSILKDQFEILVIVGNINTNFFGSLLENQIDFEKLKFFECEILEFNPKKRAGLIRNWVSLDPYLEIQDIKRKTIELERNITNLIGRNFIPSYPLFILMILQQLESSKKIDPNLGDYGYLYQSLITIALQKNSKPNFTIDMQLGFLSEFSYYLFNNRQDLRLNGKLVVDKSAFFQFTHFFNDKQRLTLDSDFVLQTLQSSAILEENGNIYFKYTYIYYFFIGKYFADHISEFSIHAIIEEMCQKLHFNEFSNILNFLCYQSKDPFIAQSIISNSRSFLTRNNEFDIVEGSKLFANSVENLPDIIEEIERTQKDEIDEQNENDKVESEDQIDESSFDRDLSEMVQLSVACKSINLMGLLIKNFPGTLPGEIKEALVKETCSLGLRILDHVFNSIEPAIKQFVIQKLESIRENHKDWQIEKICSKIRESLVGLLETSSFICIKMISNALGNELINPILIDVVKMNEMNSSYKFVEISLKLDHYKIFPEKEIFILAEKIHKKPFSYYLLKYLVAYYYYVLGIESSKKDSIYARLDMKPTVGLPSGQKQTIY